MVGLVHLVQPVLPGGEVRTATQGHLDGLVGRVLHARGRLLVPDHNFALFPVAPGGATRGRVRFAPVGDDGRAALMLGGDDPYDGVALIVRDGLPPAGVPYRAGAIVARTECPGGRYRAELDGRALIDTRVHETVASRDLALWASEPGTALAGVTAVRTGVRPRRWAGVAVLLPGLLALVAMLAIPALVQHGPPRTRAWWDRELRGGLALLALAAVVALHRPHDLQSLMLVYLPVLPPLPPVAALAIAAAA